VKNYDLDQIDRSFPAILAAIGWTATKRTANRVEGACPIHGGTHPNFHLDRKPDGKWIATCRSQCGGAGWTATRFVAEYLSIPHGEAIAKAAELAGISPTESTPAFPKRSICNDDHAAALREQQGTEAHRQAIGHTIARRRASLLSPYLSREWHYDLWDASPILIPYELDEQAHLVARHLFHPEENLWMGDEKDSGQPRHAAHFRPREEWQKETRLPPRIAAGTFHPGSTSRGAESLSLTPFIIIESDDLIGRKPETPEEREENRRQCAALIAFMRDTFKLTLRAVIDTRGKSLHAWFDRPSPAALQALATIAEYLAIDALVITRAHNPFRLPGCIHASTEQPARLCFLNPRSF